VSEPARDGRRVYRVERRRRRSGWRTSDIVLLLVIIVVSLATLAYAGYTTGFADPLLGRGAHTDAEPAPAAVPTNIVGRDRPPGHDGASRSTLPPKRGDGVKVATFLGDQMRRSYGVGPAPRSLNVIWRCSIGTGNTSGVGKKKVESWSGTGWTGQPALVRDKGKLYLLVGGFDHNLHKIDAATGEVLWEYEFPDVIKGSPTVFRNPHPTSADDRYIVMCGSRRGFPVSFTDPDIAVYRAVTFGSGKELWRLPVPLTTSYSRDCDGSGFYLDGHVYVGVESGLFYDLDPLKTVAWNSFRAPVVEHSQELFGDAATRATHGGNLVLEASPALLGDTIYIASGAGFLYGMRRSDLKIVWQYRTGSDLDGTAVTTADGKLLLPIEKQYIPGHGGVMLLDPSKPPAKAPVWFFPTGDRNVSDWLGGVIGSVAVNDSYDPGGERPRLAAFNAIDGNLYVVARQAFAAGTVPGPNNEPGLRTPKLVFSDDVGGAISTPIFAGGDTIVSAGYDGLVHLYRITYGASKKGKEGALQSPNGQWWTVTVEEKATFSGGGSFESTPIVWDGRLYIGSRGGYLYCLGTK